MGRWSQGLVEVDGEVVGGVERAAAVRRPENSLTLLCLVDPLTPPLPLFPLLL